MLKLTCSESEGFDKLTVLFLKQKARLGVQDELRLLVSEIEQQIGGQKFEDVLASQEYFNLYDANRDIWMLVDVINEGNGNQQYEQITADIVNNVNNLRYKFKKKLQQKHFGNELTEKKNHEQKN